MRNRWRAVAILALAAVAVPPFGGCGGGGADDGGTGSSAPPQGSTQPAIGPIPAAEFATVPPPTFNQVIAAFRTVTRANPALLGNEPALSRALFDEVKRTTTSAAAAARARKGALEQALSTRQALFDPDARLTLEEWKLVIRSPLASARAAPTIEVSANAAIESMPCDADVGFIDGKADALRHAYWNALMARRTSAAFAELFATAHEVGSNNSAAASAMDEHNNAAGRALAQRYPSASDDELLQLLLQQSFTFVAAGGAIAPSVPGLVHIAERAVRPFDGGFDGTLTQPDSGSAPWVLRLELSQCGAVVRGNWRATRDGAVVERRFSGTLSGTASLTLTVADPLPFETKAGPSPCLGLSVQLNGDERTLSGAWSSPGCPQGGQIAVAR